MGEVRSLTELEPFKECDLYATLFGDFKNAGIAGGRNDVQMILLVLMTTNGEGRAVLCWGGAGFFYR